MKAIALVILSLFLVSCEPKYVIKPATGSVLKDDVHCYEDSNKVWRCDIALNDLTSMIDMCVNKKDNNKHKVLINHIPDFLRYDGSEEQAIDMRMTKH